MNKLYGVLLAAQGRVTNTEHLTALNKAISASSELCCHHKYVYSMPRVSKLRQVCTENGLTSSSLISNMQGSTVDCPVSFAEAKGANTAIALIKPSEMRRYGCVNCAIGRVVKTAD